jgi:hypothetical protein
MAQAVAVAVLLQQEQQLLQMLAVTEGTAPHLIQVLVQLHMLAVAAAAAL